MFSLISLSYLILVSIYGDESELIRAWARSDRFPVGSRRTLDGSFWSVFCIDYRLVWHFLLALVTNRAAASSRPDSRVVDSIWASGLRLGHRRNGAWNCRWGMRRGSGWWPNACRWARRSSGWGSKTRPADWCRACSWSRFALTSRASSRWHRSRLSQWRVARCVCSSDGVALRARALELWPPVGASAELGCKTMQWAEGAKRNQLQTSTMWTLSHNWS